MKTCVYKKDFFKQSAEVKKAIVSAINSLYERISLYENQNVSFDRIFNDDRVKYDKYGDFYAFKFQKSNIQLRILYSYIFIDDNPVIIIADYIIKKKNNKNYIKQFESAKNWNPYSVYEKSQEIICKNSFF